MTIFGFSPTEAKIRPMSHRGVIVENMPKLMAGNVFHQCRALKYFFRHFFHTLIFLLFLTNFNFRLLSRYWIGQFRSTTTSFEPQ